MNFLFIINILLLIFIALTCLFCKKKKYINFDNFSDNLVNENIEKAEQLILNP